MYIKVSKLRLRKIDDSCLVRKAMYVQRELVHKKSPCWLGNFDVMIQSLNDACINKVWNDWMRLRLVMRVFLAFRVDTWGLNGCVLK